MLDALMWSLTTLGLPAILASPILFKSDRRTAAFLLLTMIAAGILAVEIQFVVLRPRPEGVFRFGAYFPSFPSGHAAVAFAWATFLVLARPRAWPALPAASLVAISRVYLGHHHASDVVMGAALGAATAALAYGAFYRAHAIDRPRWAWWLWPVLALVLFAGAGAYLGLTNFAFLRLPYMDKLLHLALFGALAFFLVSWAPFRRTWIVVSLLIAVAIADEVLQSLSAVRTFDLIDLCFTLAGIGAGSIAGRVALDEFRRSTDSIVFTRVALAPDRADHDSLAAFRPLS